MRLKLVCIAALICVVALPAAAEAPYIFGWHFWRDGANIDSGGSVGGRPGWVTDLNYSTNFQPNVDHFRRIANEGHTIIMRVDWDGGSTFPTNPADYPVMAARYAFWVHTLKDYCHIWLIGNEEWCNYDCFREVRKAIHAVQPEAIFCPGSPHGIQATTATLGDYMDGMAAHTNTTSWVSEVDAGHPAGKTKPCYITEFHGAPPNSYNQFRIDYANFNNWNQSNPHKIECATTFVYFQFGSEYTSTMMMPMQNADFAEAASLNYTNSYAQPYIRISDISASGVDDNTARITWTTDVGSTGQIEYWEKGEIGQHWSAFNGDESVTSHSAVISGLVPGRTYEYMIKCYRGHRPLTFSAVQTYVHEPPTSGTIAGFVKLPDGSPVHNAVVTRTPGGISFATAQDGYYEIRGCPQGSYSLSVASSSASQGGKSSVVVSVGQTTQVDFTVYPKVNYLTNPGFESGTTGWTGFGEAGGVETGPWFAGITAHSGTRFYGRAANWGQPKGGIYQRVTGLPSGSYRFRAYSQMHLLDHPYNETKERIGIDPTGGANPDSPSVQWSSWDYNFWLGRSAWKELISPSVTVSGGACTVFIQYDDTCNPGWHIHAYDDTALVGAALQTQTVSSPAAAKAIPDGVPVQLGGVIATTNKGAVGANIIYVEDTARTSGIKVDMTGVATPVSEGNAVSVTGAMSTDANGERFIAATQVSASTASPIGPLGVTNKSVGGADDNYEAGPPASGQRGVKNGVGVRNIGMLVRTTGEVLSGGSGYVIISDGSPEPLKVDTAALPTAPSVGSHISVTGVVSVETSGSELIPVLRARKNADVTTVQ